MLLITEKYFSKTTDAVYTTEIHDPHEECDCPEYKYSGYCKHLKTLRNVLEGKQDKLF